VTLFPRTFERYLDAKVCATMAEKNTAGNTKSKANDHEYFKAFFVDVCLRRQFRSVILKEQSPDIIFLSANNQRGRASRFFPISTTVCLRRANNFHEAYRLTDSYVSTTFFYPLLLCRHHSWEFSPLLSCGYINVLCLEIICRFRNSLF